jgi:hypothetical protein
VKVHTEPSWFGLHLVASIGSRRSAMLLSKVRNSPVWASMHRPPPSSTIIGFMAVAGVWAAMLRVPPLVGVPPPEELDEAAEVPTLFAPPQAARMAPMTDADMPTVAPRRRNVRRSRRPATSSST